MAEGLDDAWWTGSGVSFNEGEWTCVALLRDHESEAPRVGAFAKGRLEPRRAGVSQLDAYLSNVISLEVKKGPLGGRSGERRVSSKGRGGL